MTDRVVELFTELRHVIEAAVDGLPDAGLFDGLTDRLSGPCTPSVVDASRPPVVDDWLERATAAAPDALTPLAGALQAVAHALPWLKAYVNLEPSAELDTFQPHYSYQPLVGPTFRGSDPLIHREDVLVGFTLQAPNVLYPQHHHAPPELYGVISGRLDWQVGDQWMSKGPGDVIVHRPHESHAMRTGDAPALCWVAWPHGCGSHVYMPSLDPPDARMDPVSY